MQALIQRFKQRPLVSGELLVSSLFINVLALASPLFVMQVFSRYVAQGVTGTLMTLTAGILIAVLLEWFFRLLRGRLAAALSIGADYELAQKTYAALACCQLNPLNKIPPGLRQEVVQGLQKIQQAYSGSQITQLLDVPFAALFILILGLLSFPLALITVAAIIVTLFLSWIAQGKGSLLSRQINHTNAFNNSVVSSVLGGADGLRAYNAQKFMARRWQDATAKLQILKKNLEIHNSYIQTASQVVSATLGVLVIAVGARLVVDGQLDISALIGANLLAMRAYQPFSRMVAMSHLLTEAQQAERQLQELTRLPSESYPDNWPENYKGQLTFKDVGFVHQGESMPLFESLNFHLNPGEIALVVGNNGSGKTTLMRMILGLVEPSRGQISVDGINVRQVNVSWWRQQIIYLPQEPTFFDGSLIENIVLGNENLSKEEIDNLIEKAGLRSFVDKSERGLQTVIPHHARQLALGIRRRLALARALAVDGKILVIDEPTEALDQEGMQAVAQVIQEMKEKGCTIIIASHDQRLAQQIPGARYLIDLNQKPAPRVLLAQSEKQKNGGSDDGSE